MDKALHKHNRKVAPASQSSLSKHQTRGMETGFQGVQGDSETSAPASLSLLQSRRLALWSKGLASNLPRTPISCQLGALGERSRAEVLRAPVSLTEVRQHPPFKMPEQSNDYRVVVFGAGGVGKSSLVLRFVKGTFRDTYIPTIEDTYRQVISCDKSVCTLQITDTTGSHQFPAMQRLSISKGHAFILVFSVTSKQSLEELKPIYQQILQIKGSVDSIPIMLVGNKCDETQREVETKEGEAVAKEWKCAFMETSAKMNYNVKELFQELLNLEKRRNMSLNIDGKRSSKQKRTDKIKGKCSLM
ncbi:GTP-binding protein Di-Ras1 [Chelonia mydas]|uniref:GTP-binding protein Di-Ras1 n=1 Tax=Chelonia mydas TaxID=8469 RepID=M7AGS4_CHEMY|nr:GTP-binding protein Di-Ras1 [Chelonia mydas]